MSTATAPAAPEWMPGVIHVGNYRVELSIQLLSGDERDAVAASMAWLATLSLNDSTMADVTAWTAFVESVLTPYVSFAMSESELEAVDAAWWSEVIRRSAEALIQANALRPEIESHLSRFSSTRKRLAS